MVLGRERANSSKHFQWNTSMLGGWLVSSQGIYCGWGELVNYVVADGKEDECGGH